MTLRPRIALGVLGLSLACQMGNPAFDPDHGGDETRGNADSLDSADASGEGSSNSNSSTGDGDSSTGDGDASTGDGDSSTGDGDASTGDGDASTGDGDASTGDGDDTTATGDGDGDPGFCGDGVIDPGEECDDGNILEGDMCNNDCTLPDPDTTGDGDGDGDGDGGMVSCPIVMNPVTCSDCVNLECCQPGPLACLDDPVCMCVVHCLLQGQWGEMACYQQICMADINKAMMVDAAFPCIQTHCPQLCAN